jgi:hypothetical protein
MQGALTRVVLFVVLMLGCGGSVQAANSETKSARKTYSRGETICKNLSLSAIVGKSPWLVMGVGGAWEYINTPADERDKLSFFAQPWVWGSILSLVLIVVFKDTILSAASYLKAPLNALAELFHASGAVVGLVYLGSAALGLAAEPTETAALAGIPVFAADSSSANITAGLLWLLMAVIHSAVWVVFNSVEVLIILNPFPFIDTALKAMRTAILGGVAVATQLHPIFGFALALPIILLSFWLSLICTRLLILGWVFSVDTLKNLLRVKSHLDDPLRAFSTWFLRGAPVLSFGKIVPTVSGWDFVFNRYVLFWKQRIPLPTQDASVWCGVLSPVYVVGQPGLSVTLLRFPPRYNGHEGELSQRFQFSGFSDGSLGGNVRAFIKNVRVWAFRGALSGPTQ